MPLADEITRHRDLILADLDAAHDYYVNTKAAWRIVHHHIKRGGKVSVHNNSTGNRTTEREMIRKARFYVTHYLAVATFQQFVTLFEDFVFGLLRQWLFAYPQRLGNKQIAVSVVLAAPDLQSVKLAAVDSALNDHRRGHIPIRDDHPGVRPDLRVHHCLPVLVGRLRIECKEPFPGLSHLFLATQVVELKDQIC